MANSKSRLSSSLFKESAATCLARHVGSGQKLLVGLSGGLDSVSLLHALGPGGLGAGSTMAAIHVHHGLSPNADAWQEFCERLCHRWGIPLTVERVSVGRNSGEGLEGAARRARHDAYGRAEADWIVLAHHRGDQAETLVFNLCRGCGLAGAAAMTERNGRLLRPLLGISRETIFAYARENNLDWIEDESNLNTDYSRNYLRHKVLGTISGRFPAAEENLAAATRRFAESLALLDELAELDLAGHEDFPLEAALLAGLSEPRARNALRYLLDRKGIQIPSEQRLVEACHQLRAARADRHPQVAFGKWVIARRGRLVVAEPQRIPDSN